MAAYDITAPDGKTYRLEGPEGASKIDLINALAAKYPMAVQTTEELEAAPRAPFSAGNLFKGLSSAALSGAKRSEEHTSEPPVTDVSRMPSSA